MFTILSLVSRALGKPCRFSFPREQQLKMDTIIMVCVVLAVYHGVGASTPAPTAVPTSTVSPTYSCCSGPQNLTCTL